ncbi:MAG UNVERIFIED_CONTAM: two-component sensor histidine kinase, partial [Thermobifida fusca]
AVKRFAGRMQHEAARLTHLVQDLITLSRIQGGEPIPNPGPVSVQEAVTEAIDRCNTRAAAKDISLVAAGVEGLRIYGDEDLLVTALRNLIDNAINYSPEHTRVVISARSVGDVVEISVSDQGIGIPESAQQRIFERFFRVDAARSRATGGTGLGLAIVKHVAVAHGGEVTVWSKEGSGSTFTLRLPAYGGVPEPRTGTPMEAAT